MTHTPPTDITQQPPNNAACKAGPPRAQGPKTYKQPPASRAPPRHVRRPPAKHNCADLARNRFDPHPTTPISCKRPGRGAPEDVRVARGLKEALAQCPAKERAKGQQRAGANGAGQGDYNAAAQSALTRVRGAECAQGVVWALREGLRGHARAVLATSLLHIQAHLYLVDDRREDGHHAGVSGRGIMPPPMLLRVGRTHRESPNDLQQRPHALFDHLRAPGNKRTLLLPVRSRCDEVVRRPMTKSVPLDAPLDGDEHT